MIFEYEVASIYDGFLAVFGELFNDSTDITWHLIWNSVLMNNNEFWAEKDTFDFEKQNQHFASSLTWVK